MKKFKKSLFVAVVILGVLSTFLYMKLPQVFAQDLKVFHSRTNFSCAKPGFESTRKNVIIIADNEGTEMFDLMAPFYLFNATGKTNVYVASEKKEPILLVNSLFLLPHYSFSEIDSLHIQPDVVVIPNVTVHLMTPPKPSIVNWIKKVYNGKIIILSICDGSATAAATGIYDGVPVTTHASDFETLKELYPKPLWLNNVSVTESGNLYSTAGVSNAVEGSLTVIKKLFGQETMLSVIRDIAYPYSDIKNRHESLVVNKSAILKIASKAIFSNNKKIGVLIADSVNEFELASVLDTYVRTFPESINSLSLGGKSVVSKYGLTLYPSGSEQNKIDEVHVMNRLRPDVVANDVFKGAAIITYNNSRGLYPIEVCLSRITNMYGNKFSNCVKLMLDYN